MFSNHLVLVASKLEIRVARVDIGFSDVFGMKPHFGITGGGSKTSIVEMPSVAAFSSN